MGSQPIHVTLCFPHQMWCGGGAEGFVCLYVYGMIIISSPPPPPRLRTSAPEQRSPIWCYEMRYTRDEGAKLATTEAHAELAGLIPVELYTR